MNQDQIKKITTTLATFRDEGLLSTDLAQLLEAHSLETSSWLSLLYKTKRVKRAVDTSTGERGTRYRYYPLDSKHGEINLKQTKKKRRKVVTTKIAKDEQVAVPTPSETTSRTYRISQPKVEKPYVIKSAYLMRMADGSTHEITEAQYTALKQIAEQGE